MSSDDASAPVKKTRSEAQIQALNKARAKALDLRTQRNVIREKKKKNRRHRCDSRRNRCDSRRN
jgi:hypothetical protein